MNSYSEDNYQSCQMKKNLAVLQEVDFFSQVPPQALKIIAFLCRRMFLDVGEIVFAKGDDPARCFYIVSGEFELICTADSGGESHIAKQGDLVGSLSLLARHSSPFTMTASKESDVLVIDRATFEKVVVQFPELYKITAENIAKRIYRWDALQCEKRCSDKSPRGGVSFL
ncbi:cyclic nucleotide-binding domain-containing protein [Desulfotalea psychrophila]|uniref:Cyclic nucleotide-binding domain-containing protein n=1 Tax=Desulfotalea psychrophila (strain LSv54 / DSM 12343) TaxID=177439 RepID=Q6AM05_DESPS|nr:cyclic nucleotide-binding domain-containing protein [Desulfotalea psychrophila]CAG36620.1 hypothetical protein DP1891 [Desulfotalea psychrophila LSv54]